MKTGLKNILRSVAAVAVGLALLAGFCFMLMYTGENPFIYFRF